MRNERTSRRLVGLKPPADLEYILCAAESFADVLDLMVKSLIAILCEKIDDVFVKKNYVLLDLHAVKGMVQMVQMR